MQQKLPTVILLCAGRSERYRAHGGAGNKLEARLGPLTVKEHALANLERSGLPFVIVEPKDTAHLSDPGMGASIAVGVAQSIQAGLKDPNQLPSGWLILPADLPLIQAQTLRFLADELIAAEQIAIELGHDRAKNARISIAPEYLGQRGHPVGFSNAFLKDLLSLKGDSGAKEILKAYPPQIVDVQDKGCVFDVDTPELLAEASAWWETHFKLDSQNPTNDA